MMRRSGVGSAVALAILAFGTLQPAAACAGAGESPPPATVSDDLIDSGTPGFYHPAQHFRELGLEAQRRGRHEQARKLFLRAAFYSDKLSQAILAEQYWQGQGSSVDRGLGYIWMDLAAERGTPELIALRESYWSRLSEAERQRVREQGPALYAEYADEAARPRLDRELRREKNGLVGSRTGWDSNIDICRVADSTQGCRSFTPLDALKASR